jgi:hypothetical protein
MSVGRRESSPMRRSVACDQRGLSHSRSATGNPKAKATRKSLLPWKKPKRPGFFFINFNMRDTYGFKFSGLGRDPFASPDEFSSYQPGVWWGKDFYAGKIPTPQLLIPMDARTIASPTGIEDYAYYGGGGLSWVYPYLAGTYALAVQVKPEITPEEFWKLALETGKTVQVQHDGKSYPLGIILDPQALIAILQK